MTRRDEKRETEWVDRVEFRLTVAGQVKLVFYYFVLMTLFLSSQLVKDIIKTSYTSSFTHHFYPFFSDFTLFHFSCGQSGWCRVIPIIPPAPMPTFPVLCLTPSSKEVCVFCLMIAVVLCFLTVRNLVFSACAGIFNFDVVVNNSVSFFPIFC